MYSTCFENICSSTLHFPFSFVNDIGNGRVSLWKTAYHVPTSWYQQKFSLSFQGKHALHDRIPHHEANSQHTRLTLFLLYIKCIQFYPRYRIYNRTDSHSIFERCPDYSWCLALRWHRILHAIAMLFFSKIKKFEYLKKEKKNRLYVNGLDLTNVCKKKKRSDSFHG